MDVEHGGLCAADHRAGPGHRTVTARANSASAVGAGNGKFLRRNFTPIGPDHGRRIAVVPFTGLGYRAQKRIRGVKGNAQCNIDQHLGILGHRTGIEGGMP